MIKKFEKCLNVHFIVVVAKAVVIVVVVGPTGNPSHTCLNINAHWFR